MKSVILQIASRYLYFLLVIFALTALLRGHNHPGGGFIGGLLAGMVVVMQAFAFDIATVRKSLLLHPEGFLAAGLALIFFSLLPGLIAGEGIMKGMWFTISLPFSAELKLGTPLLFDTGIFLAVIGVTLLFLFSIKHVE